MYILCISSYIIIYHISYYIDGIFIATSRTSLSPVHCSPMTRICWGPKAWASFVPGGAADGLGCLQQQERSIKEDSPLKIYGG